MAVQNVQAINTSNLFATKVASRQHFAGNSVTQNQNRYVSPQHSSNAFMKNAYANYALNGEVVPESRNDVLGKNLYIYA